MNTAFWRVREGELGSSAIITLAYRVIQTKIITFWELGRMGRGKRESGMKFHFRSPGVPNLIPALINNVSRVNKSHSRGGVLQHITSTV